MDLTMLNQEYTGFAEGNQEMMEVLTKALTAGSGAGFTATGGRAMIPESLDSTLVNVLWSQDEARLFKALKKVPVKSPVHEATRRTGVGVSDGGWVLEAGTSTSHAQTIARINVTMKYLQTYRSATLQATLSNMLEDAMTSEKLAGTLWLIQQIETILFDGDATVQIEQPDGLRAAIWKLRATFTKGNIIDVHGKEAHTVEFENAMSEASRVIKAKYGHATDLYTSLMVMEDVQRLLRDRYRINAAVSGDGKVLGAAIFDQYPTAHGKLTLNDDLFVKERDVTVPSLATTQCPSAPTFASGGREANAASNFKAADAGDYYYTITSVNSYGESAAAAEAQITSVVAGDQVFLTPTMGVAPLATCFYIYRSKKGAGAGSTLYLCNKVLLGTDGAKHIVDYNDWMPGTSDVFVVDHNMMDDSLQFMQFLPMMKFDLFPTNAAIYPFLMLLFGALFLKKPEHMAIIRNVAPHLLNWY